MSPLLALALLLIPTLVAVVRMRAEARRRTDEILRVLEQAVEVHYVLHGGGHAYEWELINGYDYQWDLPMMELQRKYHAEHGNI